MFESRVSPFNASQCPRVSVSACLRVPASPCPRVSVSACLRVSASPCQRVCVSPHHRVPVSRPACRLTLTTSLPNMDIRVGQ